MASDIGYVTHKSWFFPDIATSPEALTVPGKFKLFLNESISPANILTSAIGASYSQARNNPEAYGQGWDAYGGRFGASLARSASSNFFGDFVFASIFRQDPRFFPQSKPTFWSSVDESGEGSISRLEHSAQVYALRYREEWLQKIEHAGVIIMRPETILH